MDLSNDYPKVSVIVPIYKSEAYLERCCRSLMDQTLDSIEFLFIIDGESVDAKLIIQHVAGDYSYRVSQIRIIEHLQNQGISKCRQEGHDLATGKYLYHCDSDDWLETDALASLYDKAEAEGSDLVFFDYIRHYQASERSITYSSAHVLSGVIKTIDGTLCNKLIRRSLIVQHTLRFPVDINWGEDVCMSVLLQVLAQNVSYIPRAFYHYCMHSQSLTMQVDARKYRQLVECPSFIEQELATRGLVDGYDMLIQQMKFEVKEYYLIHPQLRNLSLWRTVYPECHTSLWQYRSVPLYLKVVAWLIIHRLTVLSAVLLWLRDQYHRLCG